MLRCVLAAVLATGLAVPAAAQVARHFPAQALRGTIEVVQPPEVLLNGRPARLSPGSRIRGENNLLTFASQLVGQRLVVHYTLESHGLVHEVWVLRPEELARKPWPTTPAEAKRWSFDPDAQVWTRR